MLVLIDETGAIMSDDELATPEGGLTDMEDAEEEEAVALVGVDIPRDDCIDTAQFGVTSAM
jgi:hypothetical protein